MSTPRQSAYQSGRYAAVTFMVAKDHQPEYAQSAQLAYFILDDVVEGGTSFSEDKIKELLREEAEERDIDEKWVDHAYTAFKGFRKRLRNVLGDYEEVEDVYVILEKFRNGINAALSDYGYSEPRAVNEHPAMDEGRPGQLE